MKAMFQDMLQQLEVVDSTWSDEGPIEIVFVDESACDETSSGVLAARWNMTFRGGRARPPNLLDGVAKQFFPRIMDVPSPNIFFAPVAHGFSELHAMLASLLPDQVLEKYNLPRMNPGFWLWPILEAEKISWTGIERKLSDETIQAHQRESLTRFANRIPVAFRETIWRYIMPSRRYRIDAFATGSSLRLLADDTSFWMNRLYRMAIARYEGAKTATDANFKSFPKLNEFANQLPPEKRAAVRVLRPKETTILWDVEDPNERNAILEEAISGRDAVESLEPVLEVLRSKMVTEDFSERYSWVKEDFERQFHRRRSKIKVSLIETEDDLPVWNAHEPEGFDNLLLRDVLCFFDEKDRHLILAIRQGKTISEISKRLGHNGHAAVSRRLKKIRRYLKKLLSYEPDRMSDDETGDEIHR